MTRFLILIFFFAFSNPIDAQQLEWENSYRAGMYNKLISIKAVADGGYICGGTSDADSSCDKHENSINWNSHDYWIIKSDALGNIIWENTIGGMGGDILGSLDVTSDGGFILGGTSDSGIGADKTVDATGVDYWIIKLNGNGNIMWQKSYGANGNNEFQSIQQTSDGGFIIGGTSSANISGDKTENCIGLRDYWILKLDSLGNLEWQNTIGGDNEDWLESVQETQNGFIVIGSSQSGISGDKSEAIIPFGQFDIWVVNLDSGGNILWENSIGGDDNDLGTSIQQTNDGGYICGTYSGSSISGDKTEYSDDFDYWIIKLTANGDIEWQNTVIAIDDDLLESLVLTSDGGFVVGGWSTPSQIFGDRTENSIGEFDYWIIKFDASGNIVWQNMVGGLDEDRCMSIDIATDGGIICGGYSESGIGGDKTEPPCGNFDYWVVKLRDRSNFIQGYQFLDANLNGVKDAGELPVVNHRVAETNPSLYGISGSDGFYSIGIPDTGSFEAMPETINYYNTVPLSHTAVFNGFHQIDSLNDFAFQPTGNYNDLCVTISPVSAFRPGMNAVYSVNYSNPGTTTISPVVVFYPDSNVVFVSSIPIPSSITADSVVYNLSSLAPMGDGQIQITVTVNPGVAFGSFVNSTTTVYPIAGDVNPSCNYAAWEVMITGSYDPNDISVDRKTVFDYEMASPPWLDYLIRFQNTGNDTAFYVRIDNKFPIELGISDFEMINSSHPCNLDYNPYDSTMRFIFNNILLPDSVVDEVHSHGFVRYRIKPASTLVAGDSIRNRARIIFDYNTPVETNDAFTEIIILTGISTATGESITKIYPNPVTSELHISFSNPNYIQAQIDLYDVLGKRVRELFSGEIIKGNTSMKFDINSLPKGVYTVVISGLGNDCKRIVKL